LAGTPKANSNYWSKSYNRGSGRRRKSEDFSVGQGKSGAESLNAAMGLLNALLLWSAKRAKPLFDDPVHVTIEHALDPDRWILRYLIAVPLQFVVISCSYS